MTLRSVFRLALNNCIASGLALCASSGFSTSVCADTLPTITVIPCPTGGVPVFNGDNYYCGDPSTLSGNSGTVSATSPSGTSGGSGSLSSTPTPAEQTRLEKCAIEYGSYKGQSGPNPAYTTKFSDQYGWYATNANGAEVDWRGTVTARSPAGSPGCQGSSWSQNDATTFPAAVSCNGTAWSGKTTIIWASAYTTDAWMVNVLAHEWAHQWGATEAEARQVGIAAKNAYSQDGGKKCQ